jgi:CRP/FNR family transcriptional regulator, anaerobic regulatory protein
MTELLTFLASVHPLPDTLKERLHEIIKEKKLARKEFLVRSGRICGHLYFIKAGLVRCFYCQGHQDISAWFAGEGHLCTVMESLVRQQYSRENIQAL